jgi:hypothetical protein
LARSVARTPVSLGAASESSTSAGPPPPREPLSRTRVARVADQQRSRSANSQRAGDRRQIHAHDAPAPDTCAAATCISRPRPAAQIDHALAAAQHRVRPLDLDSLYAARER